MPPPHTSSFQTFGQFPQASASSTLSPNIYQPQAFDFSNFDGSLFESNGYPPSASQSAPSSNLASPLSQAVSLGRDDLMLSGNLPQSPNGFMNYFNSLPSLDLSRPQQPIQPPSSAFSPYGNRLMDVDMANLANANFNNIFEVNSHHPSDFTDSHSAYSSQLPDGSLFSDSGLVPDEMQGFLDLTGGEGEAMPSSISANAFGSPLSNSFSSPSNRPSSLSPDAHTRQMVLAALGQHGAAQHMPNMPVVPPPQPAPDAPRIATIIPAEGPVAGGTTVAVIGMNFAPGTVVLFGDRAAKVQVVQPGFIQCQAPPSAIAGVVEVSIGGVLHPQDLPPQLYKYNMMDTDLYVYLTMPSSSKS